VQAPAVGLIVTGSLGLAGFAVGLLFAGFAVFAQVGAAPDGEGIAMAAFMIGMLILNGGLNLLLIFGGLKMKRLENYRLAMAAAIAGIVPFACMGGCTGGCSLLLGLIFGIWSVIVLADGQVRAAFDQVAYAARTIAPPPSRP
jgi:hypothetical protein